MLQASERPARTRSRVHRAKHIVGELRRLLVKIERAYELETAPDARQWCRQTADALDRQITAADAGAVGGFADPRPGWKARKRQLELL